jgi:hypothetical protein
MPESHELYSVGVAQEHFPSLSGLILQQSVLYPDSAQISLI